MKPSTRRALDIIGDILVMFTGYDAEYVEL